MKNLHALFVEYSSISHNEQRCVRLQAGIFQKEEKPLIQNKYLFCFDLLQTKRSAS